MNDAELAIISTLETDFRAKIRSVIAWAQRKFIDRPYRISLMTYSDPSVSGRRTPKQQYGFFLKKKSKCDGYKILSQHQFGKATHLGFRDRKDNFYCPDYDDMPPEMKADFDLLIDKCEEVGLKWGGPKDAHHVEAPKTKAEPAAPEAPSVGDNALYGGE